MSEVFQYINFRSVVQKIFDLCFYFFQYYIFSKVYLISLVDFTAVSSSNLTYNPLSMWNWHIFKPLFILFYAKIHAAASWLHSHIDHCQVLDSCFFCGKTGIDRIWYSCCILHRIIEKIHSG